MRYPIPMNITLISPFHGGSHAAWADGYQRASAHTVTPLTLPDRHWKWRMHGGAVTLARRFLEDAHTPDLILATDMLDLTTFLALTRTRTAHVPVALYMHENQLTYPWPDEAGGQPPNDFDRHYAFINYTSMLAADAILFNSHYHRDTFFDALPDFLKPFPDHNEPQTADRLHRKSHVLPVGIDLQRLNGTTQGESASQSSSPTSPPFTGRGEALWRSRERGRGDVASPPLKGGRGDVLPAFSTPLIVWNQRWEYDKNPELFFDALYQIAESGIPFRLALCGERYSRWPSAFNDAQERLHDRIIHAGYATPDRYRELLWDAAITISTAHHEFFGISILEAIHCHTFPLLPRRLSYPELIPAEFHDDCLYSDQTDLVSRLANALTNPTQTAHLAAKLAPIAARYDWSRIAHAYDALFNEMSNPTC